MPRRLPRHPCLLIGLPFFKLHGRHSSPKTSAIKKSMSRKRKTGVWSTDLGFPALRSDPRPRIRKPLPRRARQRAKAQLRCACRRPVARIESKHPHASYEMEWTPHGDPQHPLQQYIRLCVLPRALLRSPGRPRRPRGLGSRQPHPQKLLVVFV